MSFTHSGFNAEMTTLSHTDNTASRLFRDINHHILKIVHRRTSFTGRQQVVAALVNSPCISAKSNKCLQPERCSCKSGRGETRSTDLISISASANLDESLVSERNPDQEEEEEEGAALSWERRRAEKLAVLRVIFEDWRARRQEGEGD